MHVTLPLSLLECIMSSKALVSPPMVPPSPHMLNEVLENVLKLVLQLPRQELVVIGIGSKDVH